MPSPQTNTGGIFSALQSIYARKWILAFHSLVLMLEFLRWLAGFNSVLVVALRALIPMLLILGFSRQRICHRRPLFMWEKECGHLSRCESYLLGLSSTFLLYISLQHPWEYFHFPCSCSILSQSTPFRVEYPHVLLCKQTFHICKWLLVNLKVSIHLTRRRVEPSCGLYWCKCWMVSDIDGSLSNASPSSRGDIVRKTSFAWVAGGYEGSTSNHVNCSGHRVEYR